MKQKTYSSLLLPLFLFSPFQKAQAFPTCKKAFVKKESRLLRDYPLADLKNPLASSLLKGYTEAQKIHWIGRKKEVKEFEGGIARAVEFLENEYREENFSIAAFPELLAQGIRAVPKIVEFANEISGEEAFYSHLGVQAIFAFFGKHIPTALKMKDQKQVEWAKINSVLKLIAGFDTEDKPKFTLHKIKDTVEQWDSFVEFILCRAS